METSSGNAVFGNEPGYRMRSQVAYPGQWTMSRRCETKHEVLQDRQQMKSTSAGKGFNKQLNGQWTAARIESLAQMTERAASYTNIHGQSSYTKARADFSSSSSGYTDGYQSSGYESARDAPYRSSSVTFGRGATATSPFQAPPPQQNGISTTMNSSNFHQYPHSPPPSYSWQQSTTSFASPTYGAIGTSFSPYGNGDTSRNGHGSSASNEDSIARHSTHQPLAGSPNGPISSGGDATAASMPRQSSFSPIDPMDDFNDISPRLSDVSIDSNNDRHTPPSSLSASSAQERGHAGFDSSSFRNGSIATNGTGSSGATIVPGMAGSMALASRSNERSRTSRRGVNRDEFDGPHQFLPRPTPQYIAMQERELPHLPTNLLVQEQDSVLSQVNDRLSQCAFDFVARYQFPVPLTQDMRPVARPQDREWTEWVQLLKRLATKRRIPARVLYNGQIKQFVTILENSLEMRHAARHQSRPLKDDRNILQLISAGIQVAKILKDAPAMSFLDQLYIATDQQIQDRSASAAARFRG